VNWDAISAIAEILGAIGVVATVIYLAFQIRQNTKSIQGSTEQALMNHEMETFTLIAQHASVYRRGCASLSDLDADEVVVFEHLVLAVMSQMYSAYVQFGRNLVPESVWKPYLTDWSNYLEQPGFHQAWANLRASYPAEFLQAIDQTGETGNRTT